MCFHVCGHSCVGHRYVEVHLCGGPRLILESSSVALPLYLLRQGLIEPGAHQSQQVSSQLAPCLYGQRLGLQVRCPVNLAIRGVCASDLPTSCLMQELQLPRHLPTPAFSVSGRTYLPSLTSQRTRSYSQLFFL